MALDKLLDMGPKAANKTPYKVIRDKSKAGPFDWRLDNGKKGTSY